MSMPPVSPSIYRTDEIIKTSLLHVHNGVRDSFGGMNPAKGVFQSLGLRQNIPLIC
jgi:hypothetical protein